jgi:hypothetical protein
VPSKEVLLSRNEIVFEFRSFLGNYGLVKRLHTGQHSRIGCQNDDILRLISHVLVPSLYINIKRCNGPMNNPLTGYALCGMRTTTSFL